MINDIKIKEIEGEYVPYELALKLKNLGYTKPSYMVFRKGKLSYPALNEWYNHNTLISTDTIISAPLLQQAFTWFEDVYGLTGSVEKQAPYSGLEDTYWWYMIVDSKGEDLSDWNKRFGNIMIKSEQNVVGKYLNDKLMKKYLYEDKFAFETRYKASLYCLEQLILLTDKLEK